jgi:hypothetical protein
MSCLKKGTIAPRKSNHVLRLCPKCEGEGCLACCGVGTTERWQDDSCNLGVIRPTPGQEHIGSVSGRPFLEQLSRRALQGIARDGSPKEQDLCRKILCERYGSADGDLVAKRRSIIAKLLKMHPSQVRSIACGKCSTQQGIWREEAIKLL